MSSAHLSNCGQAYTSHGDGMLPPLDLMILVTGRIVGPPPDAPEDAPGLRCVSLPRAKLFAHYLTDDGLNTWHFLWRGALFDFFFENTEFRPAFAAP